MASSTVCENTALGLKRIHDVTIANALASGFAGFSSGLSRTVAPPFPDIPRVMPPTSRARWIVYASVGRYGDMSWEIAGLIVLVVSGAPIVWRTARGALHGHFATDIVATLAIITAAILRQPIAGLVIVLMQTGGELLERYAARRASRAIQELEDASPHAAHRMRGDAVEDVDASDVVVGDILVVRPGELVPTDGVVVSGSSWVDASRLTGESVPAD